MEFTRLEPNINPELEALGLKIMDLTSKLIKKKEDVENKKLEEILRNFALPPIKGEITKGKIKWRGIKCCRRNDFMKSYTWFEQRGNRKSPILLIDFEFNKPKPNFELGGYFNINIIANEF